MTITWNVIKEKIRRKELYVITIIGILLLLLFSGDSSTISIQGKPITDYEHLAPIVLIVVHAISGALAIVLSLKTIPNEYERKTSHLVWIRGISQSRYHGELALANGISSLISEGILFVGMIIFMLMKQRGNEVWKLFPAFLIVAVSVLIVSLFTSLVSAIFPSMVAGLLATIFYFLGIFYEVFELFSDMISGAAGKLIEAMLFLIPNLHEIQSQAGNILSGDEVSVHVILKGLLVLWILGLGFCVYKKKEA